MLLGFSCPFAYLLLVLDIKSSTGCALFSLIGNRCSPWFRIIESFQLRFWSHSHILRRRHADIWIARLRPDSHSQPTRRPQFPSRPNTRWSLCGHLLLRLLLWRATLLSIIPIMRTISVGFKYSTHPLIDDHFGYRYNLMLPLPLSQGLSFPSISTLMRSLISCLI